MAGPLLRSGSLAEQHPLGQEGNPVYRSALQLREAIRLQLGAQVADCLAIPQPNESRESFDWYAPFDGDPVPWTSASEEERARAYEELKAIQTRLLDLSASLGQQDDSGQRKKDNRERKTLSRLLEDVIRFPGPEYVYLVNGRPVVTFWGFDDRLEPGMDSIERLRPVPSTAAAPSPDGEPVVMAAAAPVADTSKKKRRRWWWWLLLPLLLLLALLLLYSCYPKHGLLDVGKERHSKPGHDEGAPVPHQQQDRLVPLPGEGAAGPSGAVAPAPALPGEQGATPGGNGPSGALPSPEPQPGEAPQQPSGNQAPPAQPAVPDQQAPDQQAPPVPQLPEGPGEDPLHNLPPKSGSQQGEALVIPKEAMQNGSTGFLDGKWRAATGLQETRSGQPIDLEYDFKRGQGQVSIRQADGSVCRGEVAASMAGQQLRLSDRSAPLCPNGARFRPAQVTCRPGKDGIAICTGSYPDGRRFAVNMKREVE